MADRTGTFLERAGRWRYALLAAAVGLALLLWPAGGDSSDRQTAAGADSREERLCALLEAMEGVGRAEVLLSDNGAAVVCQGADSVSVRLDVTQTVRCFTGLGADRIVIFKMNESWRETS